MRKKIAISFMEGRVVRDLFSCGVIDLITEKNFLVDLLTPATRVPHFVQQWKKPSLEFFPLDRFFLGKKELRVLAFQAELVEHADFLINAYSLLQNNFLMPPTKKMIEFLSEFKPVLTIISNPMEHYEYDVYSASKKLRVPTLGIIRSWDNLFKGLRIRPDNLAVWSEINKLEAVNNMKYKPENVHVTGSIQFDYYFSKRHLFIREEYLREIGFQINRPVITLALLGPFQHQYDETYLLDLLISARESGVIPINSQIICRLHPASRVQNFLPYQNHENVFISYMKKYIPTLDWTMDEEDIIEVGNILASSDVVVSPGSTITIESAIFDTPTIVPIFHTYQPDLAKRQYDWHLANHFKRIKDLKLAPIVENSNELLESINLALHDRNWYKVERRQLVNDYVQFTDGKSGERLVNLISNLVEEHVQK